MLSAIKVAGSPAGAARSLWDRSPCDSLHRFDDFEYAGTRLAPEIETRGHPNWRAGNPRRTRGPAPDRPHAHNPVCTFHQPLDSLGRAREAPALSRALHSRHWESSAFRIVRLSDSTVRSSSRIEVTQRNAVQFVGSNSISQQALAHPLLLAL